LVIYLVILFKINFMRKTYAIIASLLFLLSSCESEKELQFDAILNISYGTSFGMCMGYCKNDVVISEEKTLFTAQSFRDTSDNLSCEITTPLADWALLKEKINLNEMAKLPQTIGCPDCADGGATYVSVLFENGNEMRVSYEYGKPPKALEQIAQLLSKTLEIDNCTK
jgi:hypothetical protein